MATNESVATRVELQLQRRYIKLMTTLAIDTLRYAKRLQAAGFLQEQAEVQAEALSELRTEFRMEIRDLHASLIRWLIPLMLGQVAATAALVRLR